eukprot:gene11271-14330_t
MGWVSILDPKKVTQALDVPAGWNLVAYLCLGFPAEEHLDPELGRHHWEVRSDLSDVVFTRRVTSGDRPAGQSISDAALYALAALCGLATGVLGAGFHLVVDTLVRWPSWLVAYMGHGPLTMAAAAAIAAAALVAAFFLTRRVAPEAAGSGVQEIEGAMEGLREVRWRRVLPVKFVGGVLALSSGLVAGREGPTIHMGASIAQ